MSVILEARDIEEWLNPEVHEPEQIGKLLKPCPPAWLNSVEVSTMVNSPRNNRVKVLEALSKEAQWN